MERRNRSLKALSELKYIDSLDSFEKADGLVRWFSQYLTEENIEDFDLEIEDLKTLQELFFKNIKFMKEHKESTREELTKIKKVQKFLKN